MYIQPLYNYVILIVPLISQYLRILFSCDLFPYELRYNLNIYYRDLFKNARSKGFLLWSVIKKQLNYAVE